MMEGLTRKVFQESNPGTSATKWGWRGSWRVAGRHETRTMRRGKGSGGKCCLRSEGGWKVVVGYQLTALNTANLPLVLISISLTGHDVRECAIPARA